VGIAVHSAGKNGARAHEHWGWIEHLKKEQNLKGVGLGRNIKIRQNKTYKKPNRLDIEHMDSFLFYYNPSEYCPFDYCLFLYLRTVFPRDFVSLKYSLF